MRAGPQSCLLTTVFLLSWSLATHILSASCEEASGTAAIAQQTIVAACFSLFPGPVCNAKGGDGPLPGLDYAQPYLGSSVLQDDNSFLTTLDPCPMSPQPREGLYSQGP